MNTGSVPCGRDGCDVTMVAAVLALTAGYPLCQAWVAHRQTSIAHALGWATAAWIAWVAALFAESVPLMYLAICLTGCMGIAVLGARRPGVGAWNFVVLGLLVVQLLPLGTSALLATSAELRLSVPFLLFVTGTLTVTVLNYLPTRLALGSLLLGIGCGMELWSVTNSGLPESVVVTSRLTLALAPWVALIAIRGRERLSEFDRIWLDFRDRSGGLWAERIREQFNRAARNAGLSADLGWGGLHVDGTPSEDELLGLLRGVLKRFGSAREQDKEQIQA
jgi:hypothetical protein